MSLLPSPLKSRWPTIDQLVATALNAAPCRICPAVHQPHANIAGTVAPKNVALAVAVEVVGVGQSVRVGQSGEDPVAECRN